MPSVALPARTCKQKVKGGKCNYIDKYKAVLNRQKGKLRPAQLAFPISRFRSFRTTGSQLKKGTSSHQVCGIESALEAWYFHMLLVVQ